MIDPAVFERVGLVVNTAAGGDATRSIEAGRRALRQLGVKSVSTGAGPLGADCAAGLHTTIQDASPGRGRDATRALARALAHDGLDIVIVVGGDGTMADVAAEFGGSARAPALLGVGAGSANAGALITCKACGIDALKAGALKRETVDALELSVDGLQALAFNDVVVGSTIVGTQNGQLVDLDALRLLNGVRAPGMPRPVGGLDAEVAVVRDGESATIAAGRAVGTVAVGFSDPAFIAKAVTGGACLASLVRLPAAVIVADQPLVRVGIDAETLRALPPMRSVFAALDDGSEVVVRRMGEGAVACADGNPIARLDRGAEVHITVRRAAITALKLSGRAA